MAPHPPSPQNTVPSPSRPIPHNAPQKSDDGTDTTSLENPIGSMGPEEGGNTRTYDRPQSATQYLSLEQRGGEQGGHVNRRPKLTLPIDRDSGHVSGAGESGRNPRSTFVDRIRNTLRRNDSGKDSRGPSARGVASAITETGVGLDQNGDTNGMFPRARENPRRY